MERDPKELPVSKLPILTLGLILLFLCELLTAWDCLLHQLILHWLQLRYLSRGLKPVNHGPPLQGVLVKALDLPSAS